MAPEGDRVGVEGIASAGLRPLGDHEEPSCGPNADRSMASRSLSTEIAGVRRMSSCADRYRTTSRSWIRSVLRARSSADDPGHDQPAMKAWQGFASIRALSSPASDIEDGADPALAVRVGVSFSGSVSSSSLAEATGSADRRIQSRHRLGRLHSPKESLALSVASDHRRATYTTSPSGLGVVGDADGGDITLDTNPFVVLGIAESVRNVHAANLTHAQAPMKAANGSTHLLIEAPLSQGDPRAVYCALTGSCR